MLFMCFPHGLKNEGELSNCIHEVNQIYMYGLHNVTLRDMLDRRAV